MGEVRAMDGGVRTHRREAGNLTTGPCSVEFGWSEWVTALARRRLCIHWTGS